MAATSLKAQHTISGKVTGASGEPLPFAMLHLLSGKDSSMLQSTFPDSLGHYTLMLPAPENFCLEVAAMGYYTQYFMLKDTATTDQLLDIVLQEVKQEIEEITVTAAKPLLERKPDRLIFNVSSSVTAMGGNAIDALKKVPGVWIRQQDNTINLVGKSNVQVLIDDRLQQLSGEDLMTLLQSIPSDHIDRIEVITAPPARYDASGNAGFVNIVLKKNSRQGLNASVRAAYEQATYGKGSGGIDLNYRNGKWNLYSNAGYSNGSNQIAERLNTPYPAQLFRVEDHYERRLRPQQYTVGADYELHRNGILGVQLNANIQDRVNNSYTDTRALALADGSLDSALKTLSHSTALSHNYVANINYVWSIDSSGKKLSLNGNRLWFSSRRDNDFSTLHYSDDFITPTGIASDNSTAGNQDIGITTMQADLSLPLRWLSLSLGGKLSFIDNRSDNHFYYRTQGMAYEDPDISNAFTYHEKVQALYISGEKTIGKWSFQGGLRAEYTQTTGYSLSLNQRNDNRYLKLFPSAFIQYQLNEDHTWVLSYSKRINRPDYRSLDPYRAYATPYHYGQGNPFLRPALNHNVELAYTFKGRYTFAAFYQYEKDHFGSVWMTDPMLKVTSGISRNFADFIAYGLNVTGSLQPLGFWELQGQLSAQMQQLKSREYTSTEQSYSLPLYYLSLSNSFTLNRSRTLIAELNGFYLSRSREDFLELRPMGAIDAGLKVLLLDKRLVLGLNASDMLASQKARGRHIVTGQTIDNYFDTRNVRFTASYKWGNSKLKARRERSTGIEEEKARAGQ